MNRLDCFNLVAATILQRLLESFPQPVLLDTRAVLEELAAQHPDCALGAGPGTPGNLAAWTLRFLVDEGFVRAGDTRGPAIPGCTLTAKGLSTLQQRFAALDPSPTLAGRLIEAGRLLAPDVAAAIVTRFLASP
ncbi:MAG: hypothetical protein KF833_18610 [Verrucomicrobiae bacterium]|nr:hypothetical protein [Verrucomicrobiae bacterium]